MPSIRVLHPTLAGGALTCHLGGSRPHGGGVKPTGVYDPRPGGSNRQERARRVGAPKSLTEAIEEIGMVHVLICVSVQCAQCGQALGSPGFEEHWPTEDAALDAAAAEGWRVGPGGRLYCSACGPVLTCEAEGHEFSDWRHPATSEGPPAPREYRHCRRCCLDESRPVRWQIDSHLERDTFAAVLASADANAEEVA